MIIGRAKVLIVEDDDVIGRGMAAHLADAGFEPLLVGRARGLSNRRTSDTATVSLATGRLLVVETPATLSR